MSVTAAIRKMLEAGLSVEQALLAAEAFEEAGVTARSKRQERNRRYYEAHKPSEKRLKPSEQDVSDDQDADRLKPSETGDDEADLARAELLTSNQPKNILPKTPPMGGQKGKVSVRGSTLPEDWSPSEADGTYGRGLGLTTEQIADAAEEMRLWADAASGQVARKRDWSKAFKTWMRRYARQHRIAKPVVAPVQGAKAAGKIYLQQQTPQFEAWTDHLKRTRGLGPPTDRNGGWFFESEWPPDKTFHLEAAE